MRNQFIFPVSMVFRARMSVNRADFYTQTVAVWKSGLFCEFHEVTLVGLTLFKDSDFGLDTAVRPSLVSFTCPKYTSQWYRKVIEIIDKLGCISVFMICKTDTCSITCYQLLDEKFLWVHNIYYSGIKSW